MRRCITSGTLLVVVIAGGYATVNNNGEDDERTSLSSSATATRGPGHNPLTRAFPANLVGDARQQQALILDDLLDRSAVDRRKVATATGQIDRCTNLSGAQEDLSKAARNREDLVLDLNAMDLSALPDWETLRVDLEDAWDASALSDRRYASWAVEAQDAGCPPGGPAPRTRSHRAARFTDQIATESKEAFVARWNQIAADYGLTQRTASTF